MTSDSPTKPGTREVLRRIIFGTGTTAGRLFDIVLLVLILASLIVVSLETIPEIDALYHFEIRTAEWVFTLLFTAEYVLRCATVRRPWAYVRSFFGIVDLLSVIPTWLSLFVPGSQSLSVIRSLRLFRVLKLARLSSEAQELARALHNARNKITVFVGGVFCSVVISGALMYFIENPRNEGFANIPISIYWAVVTLTTVGYGDIKPETPIGQFVSACIMLLGYGIIAVPTGIVSAELAHVGRPIAPLSPSRPCPGCTLAGHDADAVFCKGCGSRLP